MSNYKPSVTVTSAQQGRTFRVINDLITFTLGSAQTGGAFSLLFDQVLPQGGVPMHAQTGQETFIIFDGKLEFSFQEDQGTTSVTATRGMVVHIPSGVGHAYSNKGATSAFLFVLFTPTGTTEHFFERLGVPVTDGEHLPPFVTPDPASLLALFEEFQVRLVDPEGLE